MKRVFLPILAAFIVAVSVAASSGSFLLAENFYLHKGDKLSIKLFTGLQTNEDGYQGPRSKNAEFALYEGSKKIPLTASISDTAIAVNNYEMANQGLAMLHCTQTATQEADSYDVAQYFEHEGQTTISQNIKDMNADMVTETRHNFLKTLVRVDKPSGDAYSQVLGDELEIVLKNNPYKMNYGDDVTAVLYHKGKPLVSAPVVLYVKTTRGSVYPEKLNTDEKGQVYFKLSREGIYLIRSLYTPGGKNDELETWWASYTFAFSSANDLPNTYKEFGFGNYH
ncbi:DUF4198 domain-containing protein [Mucilaginibacter limnophilus]|uniref:DUF4198 domain-containing protein n=1 Tax=Mucilaginibacter limnophilus TaxID=1932778 RepID=A0A3S2UQI3_9SPHI|nr:DUF4198 domain-containing protein [Mucilaginibacter limnophilus]RVU02004.1 DUF4198 domain-containing protein [Mucilaginibacter limnophilus]